MTLKFSKLAQSALFIVVLTLLTSCRYDISRGVEGSGTITEQTRNVTGDFQQINASTGINVIVEQSDQKSVVVEAYENLQDLVVVKVENGVLRLYSEGTYTTDEDVKIKVKMPVISGLEVSSACELKSLNPLVSENLIVKASSGSEVDIEVEADMITVETSSGSSVEVSGKALKLETSSSSGSEIDASDLLTNNIVSQSTSGSSTKVHPILSLDAKASSGSSIRYKNEPKTLIIKESSGGGISKG